MNTVEATALAHTVEARIRVLWQQRQRDKRVAYHTPARHDREVELRALIRLGRSARRLARHEVERQDALSGAKAYASLGYHDAQIATPEGDSDVSRDHLNREGDPYFNGAFG
jgi:hypothetical protein